MTATHQAVARTVPSEMKGTRDPKNTATTSPGSIAADAMPGRPSESLKKVVPLLIYLSKIFELIGISGWRVGFKYPQNALCVAQFRLLHFDLRLRDVEKWRMRHG